MNELDMGAGIQLDTPERPNAQISHTVPIANRVRPH